MLALPELIMFAGAFIVFTVAPGPSTAAITARVLSRGARSVAPFLLALWLGEVVWLTSAVLGLAALAEHFHTLFVVIRYIGVAFLFYLAWRMWREPPVAGTEALPRAGGWRLFGGGLVVTFGNPAILAFYAAVLPGMIDLTALDIVGWLQLSVSVFALAAAMDLLWVAGAAGARRFLKSSRVSRWINRVCASLMAGAAAAIATR